MPKRLHGKGGHKIVYINGFLEIYENDTHVYISWCGNMGNRISDVEAAFDEKYGFMTFKRLQGHATEEIGTPDYAYSLYVTKEDFAKICLQSG